MQKSSEFASWPVQDLDGLSLFMFGFPTDNARLFRREGNRETYFLGCTSYYITYSSETNTKHWDRLSKRRFSREKDFLLDYAQPKAIRAFGFSGAGIWVIKGSATQLVWNSDPMLIGMAFSTIEKLSLVAATKLPTILEVLQRS